VYVNVTGDNAAGASELVAPSTLPSSGALGLEL
jgi:hypothetical protein